MFRLNIYTYDVLKFMDPVSVSHRCQRAAFTNCQSRSCNHLHAIATDVIYKQLSQTDKRIPCGNLCLLNQHTLGHIFTRVQQNVKVLHLPICETMVMGYSMYFTPQLVCHFCILFNTINFLAAFK